MNIVHRAAPVTIRRLSKSPGFSLVAILILALGIGAIVTIFSVINGALLRPLPYEAAEQIVEVWSTEDGHPFNVVPGPSFLKWRDDSELVDSISLFRPVGLNLIDGEAAERVSALEVSSGYLRVFRIDPIRGRGFEPEDDQPGFDNQVAVISWEWWQNRFGGRDDIVGRTLNIQQKPYTVIGVLPPRALVRDDVSFLFPVVIENDRWRQSIENPWTHVVARLKPDVSGQQLDGEFAGLLAQHYAAHPPQRESQRYGSVAMPLQQRLTASVRPALIILVCAAGGLLLIVCANVANLLLARTASRRKEFALRMALGATPSRITREMFAESLVLSATGGVIGVLLAVVGIHLLSVTTADLFPAALQPRIDPVVVVVSIVVACGSGLLAGLLPAWRAFRSDMNGELKESGSGTTSGSRLKSQSLLVVSEIALTVTLLVGAGLLLRSFVQVMGIDPGFEPEHALVGDLTLTQMAFDENHERVVQYYDEVIRRLEELPGVEAAGIITTIPLTGAYWGGGIEIVENRNPDNRVSTGVDYVTGDAFDALGMKLVKGRSLADADNRKEAPLVCVLSDRLVRRIFGDDEPVGRNVKFDGQTWQVVGVVQSVHAGRLESGGQRRFYGPSIYNPWQPSFVLRTRVPPASLADETRRAIAAVDPNHASAGIRPLTEIIDASLEERRTTLLLVTLFSAAALAVTGIGVFGVMAYTVSQRTRELNIRLALGAQHRDILRLVFRDGLRLTGVGLAVGLIGAVAGSRILESRLYQVGSTDSLVFVCVTLLVLCVSSISMYLPATRAMHANPVDALRAE